MQRSSRWSMIVLFSLAAFCLGCGGSEKSGEKEGPAKGNDPVATNGQQGTPQGEVPPKSEPPPKPTIPEVQLDTALAKTCVVRAGEPLPEAALADLAGKTHPVRGLYGKQATVVVFWNKTSMQALQELEDLSRDVVDPFSGKGVSVITVNVGDAPDQLKQLLDSLGIKAPVLLDGDGSYFAKVATERFPRTYVLDGKGTIRWFDTEYSESTRRNMTETIEAILLENAAP